ncbi:hypothetical protein [uncultured Algoriphagus sp.]|uniref:hypothetical protein n=1 Tax=uncultured Algoriphagus sp. TaxID=417365 RepID=UPI0030EE7A45|tara:strand:+ start:833 stop:1078 length:246 start_codon:yes stop_codon:yes gene_type:complete
MEKGIINFDLLDTVLRETKNFLIAIPTGSITHELVSTYLFSRIPQQFYEHHLPLHSLNVVPMSKGFQVIINQDIERYLILT